jgi:membrane-bound ClpP family serine protease
MARALRILIVIVAVALLFIAHIFFQYGAQLGTIGFLYLFFAREMQAQIFAAAMFNTVLGLALLCAILWLGLTLWYQVAAWERRQNHLRALRDRK